MSSAQPPQRLFLGLLLAAAALLALVVRPFASAIFLAAVLAGVLWPAHQWVSGRLGGRAGLSSALFVLGLVLVLLGPTATLASLAVKEGAAGLRFVSEIVRSEGVAGLIDRLPSSLEGIARSALGGLSSGDGAALAQTLQKYASEQTGSAARVLGATLSATGSFFFQSAMMLVALYFLLLQGDELVAWLDESLPVKHGLVLELLTEFKKVSFAVILSTVITAAVQTAAALLGYFIAGVPHPVFFSFVTFIVAFIPAVGAGAVCLVGALLLLVTGHNYAAVFLAVWGIVVVGLVDNLVKPVLIKAGMQMNGGVVFFSLVGGFAAFGGVGLLLGPLVVALFLALLRIYRRDFVQPERGPSPSAPPPLSE